MDESEAIQVSWSFTG